MYDRILIGVDGSEEAERAAKRGLGLAAAFDAAVTVLHVAESPAIDLTSTEVESRREHRERVLAEIEAIADDAGQSVETELVEGSPATRIVDRATALEADLVVLGRQGASGVSQRLLGSVTERVLSSGEVPTFVVPDEAGAADGYGRILLPTDGSENAEAAIPHGATVARRYDADVAVLNVVDLQAAGGVFDAGGLKAEFVERLESEAEADAERAGAELKQDAPDVEVRTAVERSKSGAAAGIREYAESNRVDLIVMGSRGRSTLQRKVLGSVASTVLRTADVPVLVAPGA